MTYRTIRKRGYFLTCDQLRNRRIDFMRGARIELAARHCEVGNRLIVMHRGARLGIDMHDVKAHVPVLPFTVGSAALVAAAELVPFEGAELRVEFRPYDMPVMVSVYAWHLPVARMREMVANKGVEIHLVVLRQLALEIALGESRQVCLGDVIDFKGFQAKQLGDCPAVQI